MYFLSKSSVDDLVETSTSHDKLFTKLAELWSVLKTLSAEERMEKVRWHGMLPIRVC